MPRVQLGPPFVRLRARRAHLRRMRPRPDRPDDRQGPECRAVDVEQGERRARTGAPMTYTIHDKGLSTTIGWKNKDSYGKSIPTRNRAQLYRLRKWQRRIRVSNATERNLAFALSELDRMASGMGLPR